MRILLSVLGVLLVGAVLPGAEEPAGKLLVYVGTYTQGTKSKGIYRMELDLATGKLSEPAVAGESVNPSFLALHPSGKYLYAVNEVNDFKGGKRKNPGAVSAFSVGDNGDLTFLNQESTEGAHPCHLVVNSAGKNVLAANYSGGSVCCLPVLDGGKVGKASSFVQHKGSSVNKSRQEAPHAHSINLDAANRFAFVADLGLDRVLVYRFDSKAGTLRANDPPGVALEPGSGPRHFAFHPSGRFAYVCGELDSTVTALSYDAEAGKLEALQTLSTLPKPHKGNSTAEVVVHPSGKFVYVSNRGHNSIAVFQVDEKTGKLTAAGHQGKGIKVPRNFAVEPGGRFCLVASQDGDNVAVFRINPKTGTLEPTGHRAEVPKPVCVRFLKR